MGKNEDCFNNNYAGSGGAEYRKDEGAKRPYDGPNGFGSKSHQYDEIVSQLFAKQFSMPTRNKWKLPEPETMLNCSRWEVTIALYGVSSVRIILIAQCVLEAVRPILVTYRIFIHSGQKYACIYFIKIVKTEKKYCSDINVQIVW